MTTPAIVYAVLVNSSEEGYRSTLCTALDAETRRGAFAFYTDEEEARRQAALFQDQFPEADYRVVEVVLRERPLRAGDIVRIETLGGVLWAAHYHHCVVIVPEYVSAHGPHIIIEDADGDVDAFKLGSVRVVRL